MNDVADTPSAMFRAGRILLLVGAILACVSTLILLALTGLFGVLIDAAEGEAAAGALLAVYGVLALISAAGAVCGFLAYGAAGRGDAMAAWKLGLATALLPPVQMVALVGAILIIVSPEYVAAKAQRGA